MSILKKIFMLAIVIVTGLMIYCTMNTSVILHTDISIITLFIMFYNKKNVKISLLIWWANLIKKFKNFICLLTFLIKEIFIKPEFYLVLFALLFLILLLINGFYNYIYDFSLNSKYYLHIWKLSFTIPLISILFTIFMYKIKGIRLKIVEFDIIISNITFTNFFILVFMYTILVYSGFIASIYGYLLPFLVYNLTNLLNFLVDILKLHSIGCSLLNKLIIDIPISQKIAIIDTIKKNNTPIDSIYSSGVSPARIPASCNLFKIKPLNYTNVKPKYSLYVNNSQIAKIAINNLQKVNCTSKISIFNNEFMNTLYLIEDKGNSYYVIVYKDYSYKLLDLSYIFSKGKVLNYKTLTPKNITISLTEKKSLKLIKNTSIDSLSNYDIIKPNIDNIYVNELSLAKDTSCSLNKKMEGLSLNYKGNSYFNDDRYLNPLYNQNLSTINSRSNDIIVMMATIHIGDHLATDNDHLASDEEIMALIDSYYPDSVASNSLEENLPLGLVQITENSTQNVIRPTILEPSNTLPGPAPNDNGSVDDSNLQNNPQYRKATISTGKWLYLKYWVLDLISNESKGFRTINYVANYIGIGVWKITRAISENQILKGKYTIISLDREFVYKLATIPQNASADKKFWLLDLVTNVSTGYTNKDKIADYIGVTTQAITADMKAERIIGCRYTVTKNTVIDS